MRWCWMTWFRKGECSRLPAQHKKMTFDQATVSAQWEYREYPENILVIRFPCLASVDNMNKFHNDNQPNKKSPSTAQIDWEAIWSPDFFTCIVLMWRHDLMRGRESKQNREKKKQHVIQYTKTKSLLDSPKADWHSHIKINTLLMVTWQTIIC